MCVMAYVTAIFDRTATDITNKTSKAYFNVADWERVYGNSQVTSSLAEIMLDTAIDFDLLAAPTVTTVPNVTDFNMFLTNIETLRAAVQSESIPGTGSAIKTDWVAGASEPSPSYINANLWESTIDAIWNYWDGGDLEVCPTLAADLTVTTGNRKIYVDCLDCADFNVDLQGTAQLFII